VLGLVSHAHAQDLPSWTARHGAFAFPNLKGTRLLSTAEIASPEAMYAAICTGDEEVGVRFERRQPRGENFNGRQTSGNFASVAGAVFRVVGGKVGAGSTCFMISDAVVEDATFIPLTRTSRDARCSQAQYPQFEKAKSRPVVGCWPIAEFEPRTQVAIIKFARHLNQALASLVVIDGERRMYVDYPAEFNGPGADLWRADDGGEIHPEGFEIVFLLKRGSAYLLAIDWAGAEGLALWSAAENGQFEQLIGDSWYQSPL